MDTEQIDEMMAMIFLQAQQQFGKAVKGYWFYGEESCPGCGEPHDLTPSSVAQEFALSAYIYRPRGILIGYVLCQRCTKKLHQGQKRRPGKEMDMHKTIEKTLGAAYLKHLH